MKFICKMCMTENKSASVLAEREARNWVTKCSEGQQKRPYKSQTLEKLTKYELWRVSGQKAGGPYILSSWTSHVFPPAKELITWVPGTTQCSRTTDTEYGGLSVPWALCHVLASFLLSPSRRSETGQPESKNWQRVTFQSFSIKSCCPPTCQLYIYEFNQLCIKNSLNHSHKDMGMHALEQSSKTLKAKASRSL